MSIVYFIFHIEIILIFFIIFQEISDDKNGMNTTNYNSIINIKGKIYDLNFVFLHSYFSAAIIGTFQFHRNKF